MLLVLLILISVGVVSGVSLSVNVLDFVVIVLDFVGGVFMKLFGL